MKSPIQKLFLAILILDAALAAYGQGDAFTYQGRLNDNESPANCIYDLRFSLRNAAAGGSPVGGTNTIAAVSVSNGLFTVTLDFGAGVFTGGERWLEIAVKSNGVAGAHTPLTPLQPLKPSPYAIFAGGAQTASSVVTGGVGTGAIAVGAVNSARIADGSIQFNDLNSSLLNDTFWRLDGNSGPGHFLGSTDNRPLEFRVNGSPALRLEPVGTGVNIVGGYSSNSLRSGISGAAVLSGGQFNNPNRVEGSSSVVGGGWGNTNSGVSSFLGGGVRNVIEGGSFAHGNFIGAGHQNVIGSNASRSVIVGGLVNSIHQDSSYGLIAGGQANTISANANHAVIGGGSYNTNRGGGAFIGGGIANRTENFDAVVVGGAGNVNAGYRAFIGGGEGNVISNSGTFATIGGGVGGVNDGYSATIAGGFFNTVSNNGATIGGGGVNFATGINSVIAGGSYNRNAANNAAIGGGEGNVISNAPHAAIAGGIGNQSLAGASFTGGGSYNANDGPGAVIGGGYANRTENFDAVIGGGGGNINASYRGFIGSGEGNIISNSAPHAAIGGGYGNRTSGGGSFIGGGGYNTNNGPGGVIGGGYGNRTDNYESVIGGGLFNFNAGYRGAIGGGEGNFVQDINSWPTIGGGRLNGIYSNNFSATIAGGEKNVVQLFSSFSFIGGGLLNVADGEYTTLGGGLQNRVGGDWGTVPGGRANAADGIYSFAAGQRAKALHQGSFVWADSTNANFVSTSNDQFSVRASGGVRFVTGGAGMTLDGQPVVSGTVGSAQLASGSVVRSLNSLTDNVTLTAGANVTITPSGNTLQIAASFLGPVSDSQLSPNIPRLNAPAVFTGPVTFSSNATGSFHGTFTGNGAGLTNLGAANLTGTIPDARLSANVALRDASQTFSGNNTFNNDVVIADPAALSFGSNFRQMVNLLDDRYAIGVQKNTVYFRTDEASRDNGFAWFKGGTHSDDLQDSGGGVTLMTLTDAGLTVNGVFVSSSDRNLKENFAPVNPQHVLAKVAALPISSWSFKGGAAVPHVGPMAQDFHAAFGLGADDRHIATVDADGVALAAIQGLNQKVEDKEARIRALENDLASLKELVLKLSSTTK